MIKKIYVIFFVIFAAAFTQENTNYNNTADENTVIPITDENNNIEENNENTAETNFFNAPLNNTNNADEPAILQDIRNIQDRASVSNGWMFIRAIIGFIITLVGIYFVFIYLKNKSKKVSGSSDIIKVIATTPIAANRYISIIEIVDDMYLVSVSDHNINLLSKIEDKETKDQIKMMYINSKNNMVDDSFKNILNQTLSVFKQPKIKEKDPLKTTSEIRERLRDLNADNPTNNDDK
ncbi:flagellar biosynthetic protein FliO [uncultured Brachyspira sp.]|uniref:FliO/MopB family protein n=1 Tax=uncultured Brachyspira sp. TaxID=221953 RepID=UPI0026232D30|nr:flagellar biosynthetic protein FliO [uncultured Brachyspira sp.]